MSFALVSSGHTDGTAGTPNVTLDTTGATVLYCAIYAYESFGAVSDNRGNAWTAAANRSGASQYLSVWYCLDPVGVGPGHVITPGAASFWQADVAAFGGADASLDSDTGVELGTAGLSMTIPPVTPTADGSLLLLAAGYGTGSGAAAPPGWSAVHIGDYLAGSYVAGLAAYQVQSAAAPVSPEVSWASNDAGAGVGRVATLLVFRPAGVSPPAAFPAGVLAGGF